MQTLSQIDIQNKRVIIREDFNVPMKDGHIMNDQRLKAALPTIQTVLEQNAGVILLSHLGRPQEGIWEEQFSLEPIAEYLSEVLSLPVRFEKDYLDGLNIQPGEIVLCENVRFNAGEKANDAKLAQKMAKLGDVFIMDAFATSHRAEVSTCGIMKYIPSVPGPLLQRELAALNALMENPQRPLTAIVGGAKVSDKLILLKNLVQKVDNLIIGGGIANTFLAASGFFVGESLHEPALLDKAREILALAKQHNCHIPLPKDVVVAESLTHDAKTTIKSIDNVSTFDKILDIGPSTAEMLATIIHQSKTILWNGPVGVFEMPPFAAGTKAVAEAVATSSAFSVAGGGDTLSAVELFGVADKISYLSTGGGAFLEYIEGKTLPAIEALG